MYELALIFGLGIFTLRSFKPHHEEIEVHNFGDKVGKLWEIVHQGMRENRLLRAEKALLTILKIDEKNAAAYNRLGILYAKQKEFKDAIDCFEIACSIEPTASSLHNLGLIYYETENYQNAVIAFEEALKLEGTLAARHIALAKALERLGNQKAMIEKLEHAAEIEPNKETFTILSRSYKSLGMADKADLIDDKLSKLIIPAGAKHKQRIKRRKRIVV
ncbi:MAG: tetratricopeptide repeat protein [Candidatus Saccharimonadales bacterium]